MADLRCVSPIHAIVDAMSRQWQRERSLTQMTLGGLIATLQALPQDGLVVGLGGLLSYRGYYSDLAFEPSTQSRSVEDLLQEGQRAMGRTFEGYKGGDYLMGETTPLWVSGYGDASGDRLMALDTDGDPIRPVVAREDD